MSFDLVNLVRLREINGLTEVAVVLNREIPGFLAHFNNGFGLQLLGRPSDEPLATERQQLTSFRGRVDSLVEFGLGVALGDYLEHHYGTVYLAFAVEHRYPHMYIRALADNTALLRIGCQTLHDAGDGMNACFTVSQRDIRAEDDLLLYVAWQWAVGHVAGVERVYPRLLDGVFVPAIEIARERDRRYAMIGGAVLPDGLPLPTAVDNWSGYGMGTAIVHPDRRAAPDLDPLVRDFLAFLDRQPASAARSGTDVSEGSAASLIPDEAATSPPGGHNAPRNSA